MGVVRLDGNFRSSRLSTIEYCCASMADSSAGNSGLGPFVLSKGSDPYTLIDIYVKNGCFSTHLQPPLFPP